MFSIRAHTRLRVAQLALARAQEDDARAALEEAEELLRDALEPQYIALLAAMQVELLTRCGELDAARRAVEEGVDRIQFCSEDGMRIALIAAAGLTVEAEVAQRARDLGEAEPEQQALGRAGHLVASSAASTGCSPSSLQQAEEIAERLGATWLRGEIAGLASRARLSLLRAPDSTADEPKVIAEAPFGLTPRELQVLELVATGATNREIGERLFMAEKTASVHVSRILAKLEVRGRTEAAAVAHRHGIGV